MVDLLLDIEGITEHKGLVYVPENSAGMAPLCKQLVLKAFRYQQELGGVHMVLRGLLKSPVPLLFSCRVIQLNGASSAAMRLLKGMCRQFRTGSEFPVGILYGATYVGIHGISANLCHLLAALCKLLGGCLVCESILRKLG